MTSGSPALASIDLAVVDVSAKTIWLFLHVRTQDGAEGFGESTLFGAEEAFAAEVAKARALLLQRPLPVPGGALQALAMAQASSSAVIRMGQAGAPLAAQTALTDAILGIAERHGRHARRVADPAALRFDRVVDYIEAHLDQALDLEQLALIAGLSMHHFARAFARHFHLSPHRYVQARRVLRAKQLLAGAQRPLDVAQIGRAHV